MTEKAFVPRRDDLVSDKLGKITERYILFFENLTNTVNNNFTEIEEITEIINSTEGNSQGVDQLLAQLNNFGKKINDLFNLSQVQNQPKSYDKPIHDIESKLSEYENRVNKLNSLFDTLERRIRDVENISAELA